MEILQKALLPWQARDVAERGSPTVGGAVVRAADAAGLRTPEAIVTALDWGADRLGRPPADLPAVDVVRFPVLPLMQLGLPPREVAPWPTYATGFLRSSEVVPVWFLERTRFPVGAEYWRIHADGRQEHLTTYGGAAGGWRGAPRWAPPTSLLGPRAQWQGREWAADLLPGSGQVELVAIGPDTPPGFTGVRPHVATRAVEASECTSVFERVLTAVWRGVRCRVADRDATQARLVLVSDDVDAVARLGAAEVEPAVFEVTAPLSELTDVAGTSTELPR